MDSKYIKQLEMGNGDIKVSANIGTRTICIENRDEMLHVYSIEEMKQLKEMMWEIQYWWETYKSPTPQQEKKRDDLAEQIRESNLHNENYQKDKI